MDNTVKSDGRHSPLLSVSVEAPLCYLSVVLKPDEAERIAQIVVDMLLAQGLVVRPGAMGN